MTTDELAQKLEVLAEANRTSPDDYYGGMFWEREDIAMLYKAAAVLRGHSANHVRPLVEGYCCCPKSGTPHERTPQCDI